MHDVNDPRSGAFVPTTRSQLEEFEQPEAFVTLDTGERVSVRRHRDALNHMRTRPTGGVVKWGLRVKTWRRYAPLVTATDERERSLISTLTRQAELDPGVRSVTVETPDPSVLCVFAAVLDGVRRRLWASGDLNGAREVAVYVGALRVRSQEFEQDLQMVHGA